MKRGSLRVTALVLLLAFWVACQAPKQDESPAEEPPETIEMGNVLTEAEKAEGWQLLFDGSDLSQWRGFRLEQVPPGWSVQDGTIFFDASHQGEGVGDLMTREQFANFELQLEFKISEGSNSGILFRVTEDHEQEFHTGPEYQIIDDFHVYPYPETEESVALEDWQKTAANYALNTPSKSVLGPIGEWNQVKLVVNGPHVEHWLNGEKVVEYELWTDEWKAAVAETKFSEWPQYGLNKTGHLVLQDHGTPLWFRNLKIKVLPDSES